MGYTAGGITAGSYAASIMATEAAVSGGSVAAGGFTATMQTIGAVGVLASPVGVTLAAAGAIGGLGTYYMIHRRNHKKKKLEEDRRLKSLEEMAHELATASTTKTEEQESNEYQRVAEDEHAEPETVAVEYWVMVSAKRIELEESEHCFDHDAWDDRVDADLYFLETASNTAAKALFDPQGVVSRIDCDPADRDGWEMALRVHYNFLVEQDVFPDTVGHHGEHAKEDTPLLKEEEEIKERMKKRHILDAVAG
jgi:Interferon-induced 6-16 family